MVVLIGFMGGIYVKTYLIYHFIVMSIIPQFKKKNPDTRTSAIALASQSSSQM